MLQKKQVAVDKNDSAENELKQKELFLELIEQKKSKKYHFYCLGIALRNFDELKEQYSGIESSIQRELFKVVESSMIGVGTQNVTILRLKENMIGVISYNIKLDELKKGWNIRLSKPFKKGVALVATMQEKLSLAYAEYNWDNTSEENILEFLEANLEKEL
jgi:hypothetical protein